MFALPVYTPLYREWHPQVAKLQPQPASPVKIIETAEGFITSAEAIYRRRFVDLRYSVFLTGRSERVVSIKPAIGELLRRPTKFQIVTMNDETNVRREMTIPAFMPLKVV